MLKKSINDNIFRNVVVADNRLELLVTHVLKCLGYLENQKKSMILHGKFNLPKFK